MTEHSIVIVIRDGYDYNVKYASPDAEIYFSGKYVNANVPIEIYEPFVDDNGNEGVIAFVDGEKDVWMCSHREFYSLLQDEIDTRRNGDKRQGLIGG